MMNAMLPEPREVYSHWLRVMSSAFRGQWRLLDAQYQAGLDFLNTFAPARWASIWLMIGVSNRAPRLPVFVSVNVPPDRSSGLT